MFFSKTRQETGWPRKRFGNANQHCRATSSFWPRGQAADGPVGLGTLTVVEVSIFLYNTRDKPLCTVPLYCIGTSQTRTLLLEIGALLKAT